jgi:hypothetical protein
MVVRPEDNTAVPESPMDKARRIQKENKQRGRSQLVTAAASERAGINLAKQRGVEAEKAIASGGGKAFAGAMGRTAGGVGSVGGLGTLQMGIDQARGQARSDAASGMAEAKRKAQAADQEIVKYDIESEKSPEDIEADAQKLDQKLKQIADDSGAGDFLGENENQMASKIEDWEKEFKPTYAEWKRMVQKAHDDYGVGYGVNRYVVIPARFANEKNMPKGVRSGPVESRTFGN